MLLTSDHKPFKKKKNIRSQHKAVMDGGAGGFNDISIGSE